MTAFPNLWLPYSSDEEPGGFIVVDRAQGSKLTLANGTELIDGTASWWSACHGYCHPHIMQALTRQLDKMPHVMLGAIVHEQAISLASRLAALMPGTLKHVSFSETGALAIECALKIAVQYWQVNGQRSRQRFLAFSNSYHGDTFAAMSVSAARTSVRGKFEDLLPAPLFCELPRNEDALHSYEALVRENWRNIAGILIEPLVQAAAGMQFHDPEVLREIARVAKKFDIPLICDEVFTGFGRTGSFFAFLQAGIEPDILVLSKALTGGTLPLAATIACSKLFEPLWTNGGDHALMHGSTFAGNALACAAAHASLDLFESEPWLEQVQKISQAMKALLSPCASLANVKDVRVCGAVGVIDFSNLPHREEVIRAFVSRGTFLRPSRSSIAITPCFNIEPTQLEQLLRVTNEVAVELSRR